MLTTLDEYIAWAGLAGTTDTARDTALTAVLGQLDAAVKRLCRPYQFEAGTATDTILDAPVNANVLYLPLPPVRSVTSLYLRPGANGDTSLFTSDYLLTAGTDYRLDLDMRPEGWSKSGRVIRLNRSAWGTAWTRPVGRLARDLTPDRGAIKVTYVYGHTSVPADVVLAVHLATSLLYGRRKAGAPYTSESWNGYSGGIAGQYTAVGVLQTPDIAALLTPYTTVHTASR